MQHMHTYVCRPRVFFSTQTYSSGFSMSTDSTFQMNSVMRGYHVYNGVWTSNTHDVSSCRHEEVNINDPCAVCMVHPSGIVVGHVQRTISSVCSMFILRGGNISCQITGSRQHSIDLPQRGLELPLLFHF